MKFLLDALSRIWVRLLAFNLLIVFLPVAGVLFLDTYEKHLLAAQESTMVQEGRLLAAALEAAGGPRTETASRVLLQLGQRHEARLRVVDHEGRLLADSARLGPRREPEADRDLTIEDARREGLLYRLGSMPFRLLRQARGGSSEAPADPYDGSDRLMGREVREALAGRYGAATRVTRGTQRSVTLYSAIPVRGTSAEVEGAVLVSRSTYRILRTLDDVRIDIFRVFLLSLAAAVLLTAIAATTVVRPLARLRRQAEATVDRRGRLQVGFDPTRRRDEIGDLERALAELTQRLERQMLLMESFAADVAHEFRNPLAGIRTATEMASDTDDTAARTRFLDMAQRDVARLERLLSDAREVSRIDALLEREPREIIDLASLVSAVVDGFRLRLGSTGPRLVLVVAEHDLSVSASADRLTQVLENVLDNAVSFSPAGATVTVSLLATVATATVRIADEGPGFPPEHLERVFTRFFSYRPAQSDATSHSGLGLALVKAIIEGFGGTVAATNRDRGGAQINLMLPRIRSEGTS